MPIVYSTAQELITQALRKIGVVGLVRAATAEEIEDGRIELNLTLDEWSALRGAIFTRTEDTKVLTVGVGSYVIGAGQAWDTPRPQRVEQAYLRDSDGIDRPLTILQEEQYNALTDKAVQAPPNGLFYKPGTGAATGTIYFDYLPDEAYTCHLFSWKPLAKIADVGDALVFPDGWEAALTYNLAVALCPGNKKPVPDAIAAKARSTYLALVNLNHEPLLADFSDVPTAGRSKGNILTGWR